MMEMRNSSNVPGVTGQVVGMETGHVIGEVGDGHLDNLQGKSGGWG